MTPSTAWRGIVFLFCLLACTSTHALGYNGARGLWYDRAHAGHGIEVETIGATTFVVLYTFDSDGEPDWYTAQAGLRDNALDAELLHFHYDFAGARAVLDQSANRLRLRYDASSAGGNCADGVDRRDASELAALDLDIGAERVRWCLEPLVPAQTQPATAMSGLWWGGAADSGWGLGTYFIAQAPMLRSVHLLYHYDGAGRARWAIGENEDPDFELALPLTSYRGYCRSCAAQPLQARPAGTLGLHLVAPLPADGLGNRIELDAQYPGGGGWRRFGALARISDAIAPAFVALTREGIVSPDVFLDDGATVRYLGIAYAAPPTGANRWRAPQPAAPRYAVFDATRVAPGCPQDVSQAYGGAAPGAQSEDCLTLNVWVPRLPSTSRLPVMVWIHGGGLIQGGSLQELPPGSGVFTYDGNNFAHRQVVYVSINYRLGALGFLALRQLAGEHADYPASGNYGFLDQVAALTWVRDNIAAFGGDPNQVTIFGESAGGVSVCGHMAAAQSRGLFRGAIMESGNCLRSMARLDAPAGGHEPAYAQGDRVAQRLGCSGAADTAACLRARSPGEVVVASQASTSFSHSGESYELKIDDVVFTQSLGDSIADGSAAAVPFVLGINADEATTLIPAALRPQTIAEYEALIRQTFPLISGAVLARYPGAAYTPVWRAYTAIVSDTSFICPARRAARDHAAQGRATYAYYFTQTSPQSPELGSYHGLEIPYLFSLITPQGVGSAALADTLREAWSAFGANGVPTAAGMLPWPLHPSTGTLGLELNGNGVRALTDYRAAYCDFWAQYVAL